MPYHYTIATNTGGEPTWWLYAGNNEMVAWAGETFYSLANARRAAESFKAGAFSARYEVYRDAGGQYRWRAWRGSDKVAASGEAFSSESAAVQAADTVRRNAGTGTL